MKSLLKHLVLFLGYIFHRNHQSKVIYYHDVSRKFTNMGTDFILLQKHFDLIRKSNYDIVSEITSQNNQVMICFDDGWAGIYYYKDYFVKQQIFPTVFIAVDLIGKEGYLSESQIKELSTMGFRFQAHTWSHNDLTTFDDPKLEYELKDSKIQLEKMFNHSFDSICFPMGRFSNKIKKKCFDFGYKQLFSSLPGGYYDLETESLICRNCAQNASLFELKWILNGRSTFFFHKLMNQHFEN